MSDPLDLPGNDAQPAFPLIICRSLGGPHDDAAFLAGFQAGQIETALDLLARQGGTRLRATIATELLAQIELIAMTHGFATVTITGPASDHTPGWSTIEISR